MSDLSRLSRTQAAVQREAERLSDLAADLSRSPILRARPPMATRNVVFTIPEGAPPSALQVAWLEVAATMKPGETCLGHAITPLEGGGNLIRDYYGVYFA